MGNNARHRYRFAFSVFNNVNSIRKEEQRYWSTNNFSLLTFWIEDHNAIQMDIKTDHYHSFANRSAIFGHAFIEHCIFCLYQGLDGPL